MWHSKMCFNDYYKPDLYLGRKDYLFIDDNP